MNVYVRELSQHLARLGPTVDIFTRRTNPSLPEVTPLIPGVNVINITAGPPHQLSKDQLFGHLPEFAASMALYAQQRQVSYDAVHAHYWLSGRAATFVRRYWQTPFVQMFHTIAHMKNAVTADGQRESDLRLCEERRLVAQADGIIAANPDERADLIWHLGAAADHVCTIPPGVDLDLFTPGDVRAARHQLELPLDERMVLFVGRIDPIKGIDTLLETAKILRDSASTPRFLLVGGTLDESGQPVGDLAAVASQATNMGISDRVRFAGSSPQDQLPLLYQAADVAIVPSRYESFGLVAVEAMACGTPVVAARAGGLRFTIEEDVAGYLVPPGAPEAFASAIDRILSNPSLQASLGRGARICAERFGWPAVAASVLQVYRRLATGARTHLAVKLRILLSPLICCSQAHCRSSSRQPGSSQPSVQLKRAIRPHRRSTRTGSRGPSAGTARGLPGGSLQRHSSAKREAEHVGAPQPKMSDQGSRMICSNCS